MINGMGDMRPTGNLGIKVVRNAPHTATPAEELSIKDMIRFASPQRGLDSYVNTWRAKNLRNFARGLKTVMMARALKIPTFYGRLSLVHIAKDGSWVDLGLAGLRVVTDDGVDYIVDSFQNSTSDPLDAMKYHALGETNTAEDQTDSTLASELTTEYETDNVRPTGTLTEGATSEIFRTVGLNTVDAVVGAVEHGIFDQAAVAGGVLLDRTVFTIVNLAASDSLQSTYELTINANG